MSWKDNWRTRINSLLKITGAPAVKVYRSFGTAGRIQVQGHALRLSPMPRTKYGRSKWVNTFAVLRLFMVRPYANATVQVKDNPAARAQTDAQGFFRLDWQPDPPVEPGWHSVEVELITQTADFSTIVATGQGRVLIPYPTRYACLSDIDDTFLVSHSATVYKRMLVLLTQNAHSRQPFEGVVDHYQRLARADTVAEAPNPFFYVSSSEWNLYDYIVAFSEKNNLPDGIFLLNQLKSLRQLWQTGQNKHLTKLDRIKLVLETYPDQQFILLGDDTQEDPSIYTTTVRQFPGRILCVYLRRLRARNEARTRDFVAEMEAAGVACCYFAHSAEAIEHSRRIGLIP